MPAKRKATAKDSTANLGFDATLWLAPYLGRIYDPAYGSVRTVRLRSVAHFRVKSICFQPS